MWFFAIPWTAAHQASLSITNSWCLFKLMSIKSVMPSNHLILCHPLLLPPSMFPSIRVLSNGSVASGGRSIGVSASASVLQMNIQDLFPLGWTGWISLHSKGLSRLYDPAIPRLCIYPKKMKSLKKMCTLMFITALFTAKIWDHPKFLSTDEWRICVVCVCMCMNAQLLSHVQLFATLWTAACQAFLSMEFSKQEY